MGGWSAEDVDFVFDCLPKGAPLSIAAERVRDALEANVSRWVVAGRPPLDPRDLSDTEIYFLSRIASTGLPEAPISVPDEPAADDEPVAPPKPVQKIDLTQFKPGEPIPIDLAMQAVEDEADPDDVNEYAEAVSEIEAATFGRVKEWQPLSSRS